MFSLERRSQKILPGLILGADERAVEPRSFVERTESGRNPGPGKNAMRKKGGDEARKIRNELLYDDDLARVVDSSEPDIVTC